MFLLNFNRSQKLKFAYQLVVCLLGISIVIIWFRHGIMIATAEEGLPFYNSARTLSLLSSPFYDTGLGLSGTFNLQRIPLYLFTSCLQKFGLVSWQIQFVIFCFLIITPLLSIPRLIRELVKGIPIQVQYLTALFYLLNLFTLSQVFTRFVSSLIFLWSYFPLFLLLWVFYLKTSKLKYLLFLLLSSVLYSNVFVIISPLITLWGCAFLYAIFYLYQNKPRLLTIRNIVIGLLFWCIVHSWWLLPLMKLQASNYTPTKINSEDNVISVEAVSQYFPNSELLLLRQSYMFGENSPYFNYYSTPYVYQLSLLSFMLVGLGVFVYLLNKSTLYPIVLLILSWFISKGTNPPLGDEFYKKIFEISTLFQVYRNPYEKFGVVYLFGYAFFFSVGAVYLSNFSKRFSTYILATIVFLICGVLLKPMWTGHLFQNTAYVIVPSYYESANNYIQQKYRDDDARILQLPLNRGSAVTYDWNYIGEDPSEFLFQKASVSRTLQNPFIDAFYYKLGDAKFFRENANYTNILSIMNVTAIVLHNDILLNGYYQEGVNDSRNYITKWTGIEDRQDFGKIEIYTVLNPITSRVYAVDEIKEVKDLDGIFTEITKSGFKVGQEIAVITNQISSINIDGKFIKPQYTVQKLSRVHYVVHVHDSTEKFILVLSNNYSNSWIAKSSSHKFDAHFIANGFANAWIINQDGSYDIDVIFSVWPWQ